MRGVCGPDYRAALEQALPGAVDQAVADADTFFGQELPAVAQWSFGQEEAARIAQPVLVVLGEHSIPVFRERRDLLLAWLPNAETFELPAATHLLHVQNPGAMAERPGRLLLTPPAPRVSHTLGARPLARARLDRLHPAPPPSGNLHERHRTRRSAGARRCSRIGSGRLNRGTADARSGRRPGAHPPPGRARLAPASVHERRRRADDSYPCI